jgi:hypothetical protein
MMMTYVDDFERGAKSRVSVCRGKLEVFGIPSE